MHAKHGIQLLPAELQNQIAAGEVVERPSSVLKELIENALDAGATRIRVHIRDGGQTFIHVSDNGHGIPEDQLELALTRHATSKLASLEDLQNIRSFGFRGEALPSIASVSRFRLSSSTRDGDGAVLEVLHGRMVRRAEAALPRGTEVEVSDLFSNVPARLKFLKQPGTEARKCADVVVRMALAHRDVDFEFIQGDRQVYRFLQGQTLSQRLGVIWPESVVDSIHAFDSRDGRMGVHGLAGDPATAQARADRIFVYVNNRPVQDKVVLSAVREAYRGRILGKEYPQAVVFLELPPDEVDVNVHPAKTEVRFQDEGALFRLVRGAIVRGLEGGGAHDSRDISQEVTPVVSEPLSIPSFPVRDTFAEDLRVYEPARKFESSKNAQFLFPDSVESAPQSSPEPSSESVISSVRPDHGEYLGQFDRTYLLLVYGRELVLLDQHAAHERILFDMLRGHGARGDRQPLLVPLELSLHPSQGAVLQELWTELRELGFVLELGAPTRLLIRSIPALLKPGAAREFLDDVVSGKARSMDDLWAVMACRGAIKAGDVLTRDEALTLVDAWSQLPDKDYCPHGRPVAIRWGVSELEKMFKRRA